MIGLYARGRALIGACLLALATAGHAAVTQTLNGFETRYAVNMAPGSSNGSDIAGTLLFEWDASHFNVTPVGSIAGQGQSLVSHELGFLPTSALLIGYGRGIPGIGDGKDHIYTFTSSAFASTIGGLKWSEVFPGVTPDTRVRHDAMVTLLADGEIDAVSDFVRTEGFAAAFDPAGAFVVLEWSTCPSGTVGLPPNCEPVGVSVPVPGSIALIGLGLVGIAYRRGSNSAFA